MEMSSSIRIVYNMYFFYIIAVMLLVLYKYIRWNLAHVLSNTCHYVIKYLHICIIFFFFSLRIRFCEYIFSLVFLAAFPDNPGFRGFFGKFRMSRYIFSTLNQHIHHEFSLNHKKIISFSASNHLQPTICLPLHHNDNTFDSVPFLPLALPIVFSLFPFFYLLKPKIAVGQCLSSFIQIWFNRRSDGGGTRESNWESISSNSAPVSTNFV